MTPLLLRTLPLLLALTLLTILAISASPASAGGFNVNQTNVDLGDADTNDGVCDTDLGTAGLQCTLRAAVDQSNANPGPDVIQLPSATITITLPGSEDANDAGDFDIYDSVTINSSPGTIVRGGTSIGSGVDRVFHVSTGVIAEFNGFTIRHGHAGTGNGGGILNEGLLTLEDMRIEFNYAMHGGGVYNSFGGLDLIATTLTENQAGSNGGGLYNDSGTATLEDSLIAINVSADNGAGLHSGGTNATLTVLGTEVSGNITGINGGGIDAEGTGGTLTVNNSLLSENETGTNGGGIYVFGSTAFSMFGTTVSGNIAGAIGGGVFYGSAPIDRALSESTISGNAAGLGGGIYSWGDALLVNLTVSGNTATGNGGGVYVRSETTIMSTTIAENAADSDTDGTGDGGGIYVQSGDGQFARLSKSIVALNTDPTSDPDCYGTVQSLGYNLIQVASANCTIAGDTTGHITGVPPLIGPLADNGGDTQTHALLPLSPAIDAVTSGCPPPLNDQRNILRPVGPFCDMGSYETTVTTTATAPPTASPTATPTGSPTATTTPTATPTDTASPISTNSPTSTPTPTGTTQRLWGDSDCDGEVTTRDNQALLRNVLQQNPVTQTEPCPDLGTPTGGRTWGDWDCDGEVTTRDNQALLRFVLEQNPLSQTEPCPDIGTQV